jgi:putative endonuclease
VRSYEGGLEGEEAACAYLREAGLSILTCRFRAEDGEVDIIAREGDTLCFIEVKCRRQSRLGEGLASVTDDKRRRLAHAARVYLQGHAHPAKWRFDSLEITRAGIWYARHAARST